MLNANSWKWQSDMSIISEAVFRNHFWHCSLHLGFSFEQFQTGKPDESQFSLSGIATVDGDLLEVVDPSGLGSLSPGNVEVLAILRSETKRMTPVSFPICQKKKNTFQYRCHFRILLRDF